MRVQLEDFNDVPTLVPVDELAQEIRFVSLDEFVSTEEEATESLLGSADETLLPNEGTLLMYGDGGAGKTTLSMDAVAHLASGTPWLSIDVPRPLKVTIIENEGPRAKFRQALEQKAASWNGHEPFRQNVAVLEEPWTQFSLRQERHRTALALHISRSKTDVLVMGPLVTLGMIGGGTPDEVSAFEVLLAQTRSLVAQPFAYWIVHHENKAGDVSGAWERVPDTLCHVQAQGNGHTLVHWRKARWSSEKHGTSIELLWTNGRSFAVKDEPEKDPWSDMLEAFKENDEWRTAKESGKLIHISEADAKRVLADLVRRGEMRFEIGPHGRHGSAHCWRIEGALGTPAHLSAPSPPGAGEGALETLPPPFREGESQRSCSRSPSEVRSGGKAPRDDIPF